jgi:phosphoribosylanthranilate isomerase
VRTLVKICGLTDAAGVAAAVAAGADALGFVFADSVRRVDPEQAAGLAREVPPQVLRVAVMRHPDAALWREVETVFRPDALQTDAADFDYLVVTPDVLRWPVLREGDGVSPPAGEPFVYEGPRSGCGERVDWERAATLARQGRMVLAGGLDRLNVAVAIARVAPWGVDVSSAVESAPGVKDPERIRAFVAAVRAAETRQGMTA